MEKLLGYKLAHACWVLQDQKIIDKLVETIKQVCFTNHIVKCYPYNTRVSVPFEHYTDGPHKNGFVCIVLGNTLTLDFSFWVNQILLDQKLSLLKKEIISEMTNEIFKPEGLGQKIAELEFNTIVSNKEKLG